MPHGDTVSAFVASLLSAARQQEGLTMEEVADRAGLHRTYIGLLERNARQPTLAVAANIAGALGLSLAQLLGEAELAAEDGVHPRVEIVPAPARREAKRACLRPTPHLSRLTGLDGESIAKAIDHAYHVLDLLDEQLLEQGSPPMAESVELANLSSMVGNFLGAGVAKNSGGTYVRNGPHRFPDLVPTNGHEIPGIEIKLALETNRPKGHLSKGKGGAYLTFRWVLCDNAGVFTRGQRGDTAGIWEAKFGLLTEEDFDESNTPGDSGKTATVKSAVYNAMELIYYDPGLLPFARAVGIYGTQETP